MMVSVNVPDSALREKIEIGGGSEAIVERDCRTSRWGLKRQSRSAERSMLCIARLIYRG